MEMKNQNPDGKNDYNICFRRLTSDIISKDIIPFLQKNEQLTKINFSYNNIDDVGIKYLSKLEHIKTLNCSENKLSDKCCKYIKENKTLEEVGLSGNNITDNGAIELSMNKSIEKLYVDFCSITNEGLFSLLSNRSLKYLSAMQIKKIRDKTMIDSKLIEAIERNNCLKFLSLVGWNIYPSLMERIKNINNRRNLVNKIISHKLDRYMISDIKNVVNKYIHLDEIEIETDKYKEFDTIYSIYEIK
jgi:hypothetical protein